MPVPGPELPVLEALVKCALPSLLPAIEELNGLRSIRARLTALKKDRTEYIRASDVMQIYASVIKQGEDPSSRANGAQLTALAKSTSSTRSGTSRPRPPKRRPQPCQRPTLPTGSTPP